MQLADPKNTLVPVCPGLPLVRGVKKSRKVREESTYTISLLAAMSTHDLG